MTDPLADEFFEKFCLRDEHGMVAYFRTGAIPEEVLNWFKAKLNKDVSDFNLSQCLDYWKKVHGLAFEEGSPRHYLGMVDIIRITEKAKKLEAKLKEKDKRYIDALATIDQYAVVQQDMIHKDILDVQLEPALAAQKKKAVDKIRNYVRAIPFAKHEVMFMEGDLKIRRQMRKEIADMIEKEL